MLQKLKQATPGGKEGKRGRCVDITSPCCLRQLRGGGRRKTGAVCGLHTAPLLLLPLCLLDLLAPLVHPFPLHLSPPLLLDLLLLLTPLQPVVVICDVAYTLLLNGKVAGGVVGSCDVVYTSCFSGDVALWAVSAVTWQLGVAVGSEQRGGSLER